MNAASIISTLTAAELAKARERLDRASQRDFFIEEIATLQRGKALRRNSHLKSFNPFLDAEGTLRVGGCLHHVFNRGQRKPSCRAADPRRPRAHVALWTATHAESPAPCVLDHACAQPDSPSDKPVHSLRSVPSSNPPAANGSAASRTGHSIAALCCNRPRLR